MTEEEVFLAVLDLASPADRTAYLDQVCGRDVELRRQVDSLLAAHFKAGEFLDEAVSEQLEAGAAPRANSGGDAVAEELKQDQPRDDLYFLQPSTRPDTLGRIGHYEVLEVLGRGGFGIVLRALDDVLQRIVALKVLTPAIAATSSARKRFLREARSSARVRHENVVQVHAVEEQPLPYLVMEYIPGETLQQRLDRTGPLDAPEIVRLGRQIAEGLAAAHATGLIHLDIKPGNVLIEGAHERVKITDFGLARAADDASLTQSGVLAGTPIYMAPEQAKGESLDHRADLFSLGSVLYIMAAGRPPFRAATTYAVLKRVVEDEPRPIRDLIPEMPQWLADIIAKLHAKQPDDRFQSAREVADLLANCESQLSANGELKNFAQIPNSKHAGTKTKQWKWVAAASLVLPILVLATTEIAGITNWWPDHKPTVAPSKIRETDHVNTLGMKFKLIPAGKFTMGSTREEVDHFSGMYEDKVYKYMLEAEFPQHEVEITQPFYMGTTEVTVGQFRKFVEANPQYKVGDGRWQNPGFEQSDDHPVVFVSWLNAIDFCNWLSEKEGKKYRLPTEAEWEYSCRAGTSQTRYYFGNDDTQLKNYASYDYVFGGGTHRVGEKRPNDWGLYDMHGNVFEWCQDWYDANYYRNSPLKDPPGPADSDMVVQRGGSWGFGSMLCRSAFRSYSPRANASQHRGFRVVLVSTTPPGQ